MEIYDQYLNVVMADCIATFDEKKIQVGKRYRLGIKYNVLLQKEVYYIIDVKTVLGLPLYVEIESGYFEEEEIKSISFILA